MLWGWKGGKILEQSHLGSDHGLLVKEQLAPSACRAFTSVLGLTGTARLLALLAVQLSRVREAQGTSGNATGLVILVWGAGAA